MSKRKLATIEVIQEVKNHPNADSLEIVKIRGWQVITKLGEFKPGDLCVYCEIDSVMPERPEFEFLAPRKYRIKTTKLRGEISQGIVFPLSIIPKGIPGNILLPGVEVTGILGVTKYEEPIPASLGGVAKGAFPSHSIRTDEERIQNLMDNFQNYHDNYTWAATEKLDGSSCTFSIYDDEFEVSSRNLRLKEHPENEKNSFWLFARTRKVEEKMREFMKSHDLKALTLQGELVGEGIQKNKYRLKGQTVRFFRVFDPVIYKFFGIYEAIEAIKEMELEFVPIIETDMTLPDTIDELLAMADGRSALYDTAREGIVFVAESLIFPDARPLEDYQGRLSFKVISNKFLLKE